MLEGKFIKKSFRSKGTKRRLFLAISASGLILAAVLVSSINNQENLNFSGLLETIAKGESNGNYNAYYGHPNNKKLMLTKMSIGEVLDWQEKYVKDGSPSSAAGKYQIVRPTLEGLVYELGIDSDLPYDEQMQDKLAIALIERRGVRDFSKGKISREQFAHNLSKEWAALPRVLGKNPNQSYYAGDGLNKVQVTRAEIFSSIETLDNKE